MNYFSHLFKPFSGSGWVGEWSPGIGDPSVIGWITVALYAIGAWQSYRVATLRSSMLGKGERSIWWILVFGLAFLCINKQLDLQSAFTEFGRILSKQQNWYEYRRQMQLFFIIGIASIAMFFAIALFFLVRKASFATHLALAGAICLLSFIVIRAVGFHYVDIHLFDDFLGIKLNWVYEIVGICMIIIAARMQFKQLTH